MIVTNKNCSCLLFINYHYLANFDSHRCCGSHWLHWKWLTVVGKRIKWWICHHLSSSGVLSDVRPWEANLIDKQLCDKSGRGSTTHKTTVDQCAKTVNDVIFICSLFLAIFCGILVDNEWYFGEKGSSTSAPKEEVPPTLEPRDSGLKFWKIQQTFWALLSLSKL